MRQVFVTEGLKQFKNVSCNDFCVFSRNFVCRLFAACDRNTVSVSRRAEQRNSGRFREFLQRKNSKRKCEFRTPSKYNSCITYSNNKHKIPPLRSCERSRTKKGSQKTAISVPENKKIQMRTQTAQLASHLSFWIHRKIAF